MRHTKQAASLAVLALALLLPAWGMTVQAKESASREAMLSAGRAALCRVHFFFKRPADMKERQAGMPYDMDLFSRMPYEELIAQQKSLVLPGVLLDDAGHVLIGDIHLEEKYVDHIEVMAPDGTRYPAKLDRILDRSTGVMLSITEPLKNWKAPKFASQATIADAGVVTLRRTGRDWLLDVGSAGADYSYEAGNAVPKRFGGATETSMMAAAFGMFGEEGMAEMMSAQHRPMLLCNEKGQPVGALVSDFAIDQEQKLGDWQRERLLAGPGISYADLRALGEKCNEELGGKAYKCVIQYRHEEEEGANGYVPHYSPGSSSEMEEGKDRELFGLAISPKQLFVPQPISRDELANIDKFEIVVGDKPQPAEFVAAFQDVAGFVVALKEGEFPAFAAISAGQTPERMRLFLTATVEEKFGKTHFEVAPNRWLHESLGYKDLFYISPTYSVSVGGWILDRQLNILGVFAGQRLTGEEIQALGAGYRGDFGRRLMRIFWNSELAPMLANPVAFADPQIRHKSKEDAKRLVWLGVESSPLTSDLAKQLKVERETKDGTIGLYVNLVYRNSPAARLGIKEGDILLQIETAKQPHPIDLNAMNIDSEMFRFDWRQYADYSTVEEYGEAEPRWPLQINYMTMLLQSIGEGEKIKLTWLRAGAKIAQEYQIELGPPNFLCAPKFKNKEIGLTVKDVTYEVRTALRLDDERAAVVVAKIERGSPAEVARIAPFELITAMDGAPVGSAREFGQRIQEAQAAGKKSVRLTVELLGASRLADLDITKAAASKENPQE